MPDPNPLGPNPPPAPPSPNPSQSAATPPASGPSDAAQRASDAMRWAIWMLLLIYVLPLFLIAYDYLATGFSEVTPILTVFVGMTATSDDSFAILHRALLPLMGGFAPLAFRDERTTFSSVGIMGVLMFGILLSILLFGVFNSLPVQQALKTSTIFEVTNSSDTAAKDAAFATGITQIKAFLNRTQEAMAMYLLLLFGLKLEKAVK